MKQISVLIKTIRNVSVSIHVLLVSTTRMIKYCSRLRGHTRAICCTMCSFAFKIIDHWSTIHIVHSYRLHTITIRIVCLYIGATVCHR